jgi:hypothetical protein
MTLQNVVHLRSRIDPTRLCVPQHAHGRFTTAHVGAACEDDGLSVGRPRRQPRPRRGTAAPAALQEREDFRVAPASRRDLAHEISLPRGKIYAGQGALDRCRRGYWGWMRGGEMMLIKRLPVEALAANRALEARRGPIQRGATAVRSALCHRGCPSSAVSTGRSP